MMAVNLAYVSQAGQNFETYSLLWLDATVNNSHENLQAQTRLRESINHLVTFEDHHRCYEYIKSVSNHDRIVLIVSGHLGQLIVPYIVQFRQLVSIYVYCKNITENEQWSKQYPKVSFTT